MTLAKVCIIHFWVPKLALMQNSEVYKPSYFPVCLCNDVCVGNDEEFYLIKDNEVRHSTLDLNEVAINTGILSTWTFVDSERNRFTVSIV